VRCGKERKITKRTGFCRPCRNSIKLWEQKTYPKIDERIERRKQRSKNFEDEEVIERVHEMMSRWLKKKLE